jgi:hypothetical protein
MPIENKPISPPFASTIQRQEPAMRFLNYYVHCSTEWTDEWDCMCNDQCPECHTKDIEPYQSQEINDDGTHGEIIRHVPAHWVPEQGWPGANTPRKR